MIPNHTIYPAGKTASFSPRTGFTLVEMLVVIAIIGILATMAIAVAPGVMNMQTLAKAEGQMQVIAQALEQYKGRYHEYPPADTDNKYLTQALYGMEGTDVDDTTKSGWVLLVPRRSGNGVIMVSKIAEPLLGKDFKLLSSINGNESLKNTENDRLIDPWDNPYEYYYASTTDMARKVTDTTRTWKYPGFILYSKGPNGEGTLPEPISSGKAPKMAKDVQDHFKNSEGKHFDDLIHGFKIE